MDQLICNRGYVSPSKKTYFKKYLTYPPLITYRLYIRSVEIVTNASIKLDCLHHTVGIQFFFEPCMNADTKFVVVVVKEQPPFLLFSKTCHIFFSQKVKN